MADCGGLGAVPKSAVVGVLQGHQVSVAPRDHDAESVVLAGCGVIEYQELLDPVPRKMLHRLARLFRIPIEHFYHPDMVSRYVDADI